MQNIVHRDFGDSDTCCKKANAALNFEGITLHDLRHTLLNDLTASLLPPPKRKGTHMSGPGNSQSFQLGNIHIYFLLLMQF